ncbi:MAG: hypothetical protein AB1814_17265 [Thermodesulfobacteriota bacterium]
MLLSPLPASADKTSGTCHGVTLKLTGYGLATCKIFNLSVTDLRFVKENTSRIPLRKGNAIYIAFDVVKKPKGRDLEGFVFTTNFPPPGVKESFGHTTSLGEEFTLLEGTEGRTFLWAFREGWIDKIKDLLPGKWKLQIHYKNCLLLEKEFIAYWPAQKAAPGGK